MKHEVKQPLRLENGTFMRGEVEVPIEIGNAEQIALLQKIERDMGIREKRCHTRLGGTSKFILKNNPAMVTKEQYDAAKTVVQLYEDQEYARKLEQAQNDFPIGTMVRSTYSDYATSSGEVYAYGRHGKEVTLKVKGYCKLSILAKYAVKK